MNSKPHGLKDDYPFNLLRDVARAEWEYDLPLDFDASLAYVLATLTELESGVIHARYKSFKSLVDIAEDFGVSDSYIQQIKNKALRKLRHPSRLNLLICGVQGWHISEMNKKIDEELSIAIKAITTVARKLEAADDMMKSVNSSKEYCLIPLDTPIEDLKLSARPYNCLCRARIRTLDELADLTESDLLKMTNLGKHSFDEIVRKLGSVGLSLRN